MHSVDEPTTRGSVQPLSSHIIPHLCLISQRRIGTGVKTDGGKTRLESSIKK